jgi:GNAT superfamily N-acetyltransferase
LIDKFPEGQVGIKVDNELAGCALSIIVDYSAFDDKHTYQEITGGYTFNTHTSKGDKLYGIDVFIRPKFQGLRIGRRLYDYRKELCEKLNLKGIVFGGRIPNYHPYSATMSPREYIDKVRKKEIHDPVLDFQMSNDFHPARIIKGYLKGDKESKDYAVLLEWDNVYYEKKSNRAATKKTVVRLGLIQWQMRLYKNFEELMQQAEYFVDAVSGYRSDFALFPEFFNAPLMSEYNHLSEAEAIRKLAEYTGDITKRFAEMAISYNINIITGSMPIVITNSE